jgi:hypothetical protein
MSTTPGQLLHHHVVLAIGALRAVTRAPHVDAGLLCVMDVVADSLQLAANYFELEADYEGDDGAEREEAST